MPNRGKRGSASGRVRKLVNTMKVDQKAIHSNEIKQIASGDLELRDATLVLKTEYGVSEQEDLLSISKNKDARVGVNSFQDGRVAQIGDGGSIVVDAVKLSRAGGLTGLDAGGLAYLQTAVPVDIESAVLEISQGNVILAEIPISEFAFKGDEPNTRGDQWLPQTKPFVLAAGKTTKITLKRAEGLINPALGYIAIELKGMRTFPKRRQ